MLKQHSWWLMIHRALLGYYILSRLMHTQYLTQHRPASVPLFELKTTEQLAHPRITSVDKTQQNIKLHKR